MFLPRLEAGRSRTLRIGLVGVALLLVLGGLLYLTNRKSLPAPPIVTPVPGDLDQLEPQLRDYIRKQLALVEAKPRAAEGQATLGLVYSANGLWTEARRAFTNAILLQPEEPLAYLHAANATRETGDVTGALNQLRVLVERFPAFAPGQYRLGEALLRGGDVDGAERAFRRLITLAPTEWRGYAGVGEVFLRRGQYGEAASWLEQAVKLDRTAQIAHHLLGLAYRGAGKVAAAERELALGLNATSYPMPDPWSSRIPGHMKTLPDQIQLATDWLKSGQPAAAAEVLTEAVRRHPTNIVALTLFGRALSDLGHVDEAQQLFERALKLEPRSLDAHIGLSTVFLDRQQFEQALTFAERAAELEPTDPQPWLARATALVAAKRFTDALPAYETAFRHDPKNALILVDLGDIYAQHLASPERAYEYYERARKLNPGLAIVYSRLAGVLLMQKQFDAAGQLVRELEAFAPDDESLPGLRRQLETQR